MVLNVTDYYPRLLAVVVMQTRLPRVKIAVGVGYCISLRR